MATWEGAGLSWKAHRVRRICGSEILIQRRHHEVRKRCRDSLLTFWALMVRDAIFSTRSLLGQEHFFVRCRVLVWRGTGMHYAIRAICAPISMVDAAALGPPMPGGRGVLARLSRCAIRRRDLDASRGVRSEVSPASRDQERVEGLLCAGGAMPVALSHELRRPSQRTMAMATFVRQEK